MAGNILYIWGKARQNTNFRRLKFDEVLHVVSPLCIAAWGEKESYSECENWCVLLRRPSYTAVHLLKQHCGGAAQGSE